jgi:stress response protein YsnF
MVERKRNAVPVNGPSALSFSSEETPMNVRPPADPQHVVVPIYQEQANVTKRRIVTAKVRVSTVTRQSEQFLTETLAQQQVKIDRIPIGRLIKAVPKIRKEGDAIIIPIVEEIPVVEHRLVLMEEVWVRRIRTNETHRQRATLRCQEAVVTRDPVEPPVAFEATEGLANTNNK